MNKVLSEIKARQDNDTQFDSKELIGDLLNLTDSQLTPVGRSVKNIITDNGEDGQSNEAYPNVPPRDTPECAADTCCIWHYISADMASKFRGWSKATSPLGGADGSIVLAPEEMTRPPNRGLEPIVAQLQDWFDEYNEYGAGMADLIQMASTTATVVCPLGPRVRSFVGRKDSSVPAPDGLLPSPFASADNLISLFRNMTIEPHGLTALLGAHTTSQQRFVDPARAGDPQDSTPGVWDVLFYKQTLDSNAPRRVFKFQSDINLSKDPRIVTEFREFAGPGGQQHWNEDYAREYVRLSLLGVFNINNLTECTKVLPQPSAPSFNPPDQPVLNTWMNITRQIEPFAKAVMDGNNLSGLMGMLTGQGSGSTSGQGGLPTPSQQDGQTATQNGAQAAGNQGGRKPCKRGLLKRS
ncbi:hypothetical protein KVR01_010433 [Diaporthe batatas]|uniref:uncharacterized protein n=1 Tax=Diaporthe batatas TaxID=748121 RepID=UPI001D040F4A|nr:uncharacterized protein KVR01_010433 [Diaporthe batatas]KAG8159796.1 hypothetical protein KVR01_010433 [Diaporthe batatas]